jgi:hypothetical protein
MTEELGARWAIETTSETMLAKVPVALAIFAPVASMPLTGNGCNALSLARWKLEAGHELSTSESLYECSQSCYSVGPLGWVTTNECS